MKRDGKECCERCETTEEELETIYGLNLCEECMGSFDAWIRCKIG